MNNKKQSFILLRILDQIYKDNSDIRECMNKSEEENVFFEQVFYLFSVFFFFFNVIFVSNKSIVGVQLSNYKAFDKLLEYSVHCKSTDSSLRFPICSYMNDCFSYSQISLVKWYNIFEWKFPILLMYAIAVVLFEYTVKTRKSFKI